MPRTSVTKEEVGYVPIADRGLGMAMRAFGRGVMTGG